MSDHQLDTLRNKISQSHIIIEEIFGLYKNITSNEAFGQIEQQLYEVNKAIKNLENTTTPVPDALREIKNQMTNNLVIKTEADKILDDYREYLSNLFVESSPIRKKRKKGGRFDESKSLDIALDVFNLVIKEKIRFAKAINDISKKHSLSSYAVRLKCSKFINLNLRVTKNYLLNNRIGLYNHLVKNFPEYESKIKSTLGV